MKTSQLLALCAASLLGPASAHAQGNLIPTPIKINPSGSSQVSHIGAISPDMIGYIANNGNVTVCNFLPIGNPPPNGFQGSPNGFIGNGGIYSVLLSDGVNGNILKYITPTTTSVFVGTNVPSSALADGGVVLGTSLYYSADGDLYKAGFKVSTNALLKQLTSTSNLRAAGTKVYFTGNDGVKGNELWVSDGTANGTLMVKDIIAGSTGSGPHEIYYAKNVVLFAASDAVGNEELWTTDGTTAGTVMLKEIDAKKTIGSNPKEFTYTLAKFFFSASDGIYGRELWTSDGTAAGTVLLKDIAAGANGSSPHSFTTYDGKLYFFASNAAGKQDLYTSGGTAASTSLKLTLPAGAQGFGMIASGNKLFYVTITGSTTQLWCYSKLTNTSVLVAPAIATITMPLQLSPRWATAGNDLYFEAKFDSSGSQIWKVSNQ